MKIQCQSCQAKYTIADEKVLGKVVKIRCKKCSSTIVINGNEQPQAEDAADTHVFDYANQSNDQWTVNVADGDQRTMTVAEIAAEYRAGVVTDETYCWKDGMADWLPVREIEQIYGSLKLGGGGAAPRMADDMSMPPQSAPPPAAAPLFAAPAASVGDSPFAAAAHSNGNGSGALFGGGAGVEQHAPAAARRAGGRAQGADLFGNVEKAGGEDDVMTSAAAGGMGGGAGAAAGEEKLTGQRNENSVLFSLSALTDKPKETASSNRTTASADGSGLIDIRALSANMDDGEKKKDTGARVDDIMNLSGGGAFGAALAAPILAPPPLEAVDMGVMASGAPPKQNKTLVFAILGGCAFIAIAIVAAVALTRGPAPDKTSETPTATVSAATPDPTTTVAANDTTPPTGVTAATADNTPPPPGTGQTAPKTPSVNPAPKAPSGGGGAVAAKTDHAPSEPAPTPKTPDKPKDLSGALAEAAGKKPDAPSGGGGSSSTAPFDRGAAAAALGAVNVQSCKKSDGPTGSGHVFVTFAPDGSVQSAVIDSGPFPGTSVGGCIAGKYRGARVPAFGGAPVRVGKSFTVN
ncbi:MAG: zinc-ribbon domain-containing protein [Labilithrix sp.]|nr:zinc-ribbon domain-containing protein [Labilithrix sp.]